MNSRASSPVLVEKHGQFYHSLKDKSDAYQANVMSDVNTESWQLAASMTLGDDVGMNLLASVAAEEMSKSDLLSPTDSSQRNTPIVEDTCMVDDAKSKSSSRDNLPRNISQRAQKELMGKWCALLLVKI
ncbi:unnamed protein product [Ilex paraguariensis]|uniref:Uncharacterized protein n=1 Tax=Ilex paraguariensis TaxID=185542 RepID=A0ABC8UK58_9AQUA